MTGRRSLTFASLYGATLVAAAVLIGACSQDTEQASEPAQTVGPAPTTVAVEGGQVMGAVSEDVLSFKGIPFAAPPVGALRWRPPQPVASWDGVKETTAYGSDCMQGAWPGPSPLRTTPAEDCLYLNIWRPAQSDGTKLPVMVWIYGGGFVNGGPSIARIDGSQFAKRGIVAVSFSYRLGRFGFFAFPALTEEAKAEGEPTGNYAYMDQIAALKWVQANIAAFGGDPDNVTIFGESAGGVSVLSLVTSPAASGLFHKAISESGGGRGLLGGRSLTEPGPNGELSAEATGVAMAKSLGIEGTDSEALAALRTAPADKIVNGLGMGTMGEAGDTYAGGPIIDGMTLTGTTENVLKAGGEAPVPLVIGATNADLGFSAAKTMDEAFAPFGDHAAEARQVYDPDNTGNLQAVNAMIGADRAMVEPARFIGRLVAAHGRPAYVFRFSYVATSLRGQVPGATHSSDIQYVFDTLPAVYGDKVTPEDEAIAKAANAYWVNFAKTGDPNGAGLPEWPTMAADGNDILDFTETGPVAGPDPWKARLDLTAMTYDKK